MTPRSMRDWISFFANESLISRNKLLLELFPDELLEEFEFEVIVEPHELPPPLLEPPEVPLLHPEVLVPPHEVLTVLVPLRMMCTAEVAGSVYSKLFPETATVQSFFTVGLVASNP